MNAYLFVDLIVDTGSGDIVLLASKTAYRPNHMFGRNTSHALVVDSVAISYRQCIKAKDNVYTATSSLVTDSNLLDNDKGNTAVVLPVYATNLKYCLSFFDTESYSPNLHQWHHATGM